MHYANSNILKRRDFLLLLSNYLETMHCCIFKKNILNMPPQQQQHLKKMNKIDKTLETEKLDATKPVI